VKVKAEPGVVDVTDADERIPFNRPSLQGREIELMRAAVEHGHTSADGPFATRASELLRDELGVRNVLLTTSCTAALEMTALLLDLEPGDTVVVPSFGFVTTALAYARQGARILFCDIEDRTLGLDPHHLDEIMDESVRAVVPIHYSGVACDLDAVSSVVDRWPRASLIEDNAHGLFGQYREQPLGTFGRFATLSFHETKNFTCGEGGALLVNDEADADRAHVVYHKGTNRRAFLHGDVDKYTWQDVGSSFGLSDVLAAFLFAQLEQRA
jgi:dTDP-4-amino-4,6-dideoxygalactose transaminase